MFDVFGTKLNALHFFQMITPAVVILERKQMQKKLADPMMTNRACNSS